MKLERDLLEPDRYAYLSKEDSDLYDSVKDSNDEKAMQIKQFIIDKAAISRASHRASKY